MQIALFLHLYQPPTQDPRVTLGITQRSYLKIIELLKKYNQVRVTINLTGSLLEQWLTLPSLPSHPFFQVIEGFKKLVEEGQVELTGTAMYHPLLPMLPTSEIIRQIELDLKVKGQVFGEKVKLKGFFPPEMVYTQEIAQIIENLGFDWMILDESAHPLSTLRGDAETYAEHAALHLGDQIYQIKNSRLRVFFRDREASLKVAFSNKLTLTVFFPNFQLPISSFQVLAMDGETFGFHRPQMLKWLEELFQQANSPAFLPVYQLVTISELLDKNYPVHTVEPITSTWGVTIEEPDQSRTFPRWQNPNNLVHQLQWQLYDMALTAGARLPQPSSPSNPSFEARLLLDKALHSDQFWWGSANPCWNLRMIDQGALLLRDSILLNPQATREEKQKAESLHLQILETGKALYGEKAISC